MVAAGAICATAMSHHRRDLLIAALGGFTALLPAHAEAPAAKLSRSDTAYQTTPKGMFSCAICTFFVRPRGCKVVSGDISPTGWCRLFDLPD